MVGATAAAAIAGVNVRSECCVRNIIYTIYYTPNAVRREGARAHAPSANSECYYCLVTLYIVVYHMCMYKSLYIRILPNLLCSHPPLCLSLNLSSIETHCCNMKKAPSKVPASVSALVISAEILCKRCLVK